GQHRARVRVGGLRVDPRLRGPRTASHRRPDARPARHGRAQACPGGDAFLHRPPRGCRGTGRQASLIQSDIAFAGPARTASNPTVPSILATALLAPVAAATAENFM